MALLGVFVAVPRAIAQDKMRMGLSSVSALHSAMWIAEQKGLFRKHGIDAEIIVTGQGGAAGISALLANDIQLVSSAGDALVNAALHGGETVMIAGVINKGLQRIMVRPEIKSQADLKGKRVGVTRIGAVSHSVLMMILRRWNMSPTDVQIMQVGSSPNMLASLDKGGLDAAVITIPSMFVAEDRGYKVLLDLADTDIFYLQTMVATTRSYIKKQPRQGFEVISKVTWKASPISSKTAARASKSSRKNSASAPTRSAIWNDLSICSARSITKRCLIRRCAASRPCSVSWNETIRKRRAPIPNPSSMRVCFVRSTRAGS